MMIWSGFDGVILGRLNVERRLRLCTETSTKEKIHAIQERIFLAGRPLQQYGSKRHPS
jgi:hypothetical protein